MIWKLQLELLLMFNVGTVNMLNFGVILTISHPPPYTYIYSPAWSESPSPSSSNSSSISLCIAPSVIILVEAEASLSWRPAWSLYLVRRCRFQRLPHSKLLNDAKLNEFDRRRQMLSWFWILAPKKWPGTCARAAVSAPVGSAKDNSNPDRAQMSPTWALTL